MTSVLEFLALSIEEQTQYVWDNGNFLVKRKGKDVDCLLYEVNTFYVEIWYHNTRNFILAIVPFDDRKRLVNDLQEPLLLKEVE